MTAAGPGLMPADSSALASRWIPEVRAWTVLVRYRVRSRTSFSSGGGMYEPCSSPHPSSSASRAQSSAPALCPFSALACAAGLRHHVRHPAPAQFPGHRPQHAVKRAGPRTGLSYGHERSMRIR
jgi:hypothetical protein